MAKCQVCEEKQIEIKRILKAYKADKEAYEEKLHKKTMLHLKIEGGLVILSMLVLAFGKQGIVMIIDLIKELR
jgi:hypothetical protein